MIVLITLGLLIGCVASIVGLAGGVFFIPLLVLFYGLPVKTAIATSLFAMTGVTLSSSIAYLFKKKVNFRLVLIYDLFDIPGVILGAFLTTLISSSLLLFICGLVIIVLALVLMFNPKKVSKKKKIRWDSKHYFLASVSSLFGGLVTGLSGLGGGTTDTSTMILMGVNPFIAVGSSELAMLLTNLAGFTTHGLLGNLNFLIGLPLFIGSIIGAQVGAYSSKFIKSSLLKRLIAIIALIISLRLIFSIFL